MTTPGEKFQALLRELFQFNCADLDFGIYRIMNHKRGVIEKFITQDLPKAVAEELDLGALADQSQAARELKEVGEQIAQALGKEALDADGNLAEAYHGTPLGKKYMELKAKAAGGRGREALEAAIFNHLYTFFSRYYQDGDFISKRRYSKRQRYAIPYNGEEVYLYWANNDQYYVKTAEHFHDYTFSSRGVTVHFKLQAASVEQNNVKGDKRFFLPRVKETEWDEDSDRLVIPFEYRPLTEQEEISYGKKTQHDAIIAEALTEIPKRLKKADKPLVALTAERHRNSDLPAPQSTEACLRPSDRQARQAGGQPVTFLEHHLRQYTRRNTSDFFTHKDLRGFLSGELDFYLKNEVLNLDEMESAGEDRAEGWFQLMRVIKAVGGRIIDFLHQIEGFQKMLWEKRKFITETQYCITVGNVAESFYPDIAACEPQWASRQAGLFTGGKRKKEKRIAFLEGHPTLVLDTKHYEQAFVDRLLGSFDALDSILDGQLVHSENFQALNLLLGRFRSAVECVYIDPPYNTGESEILYKKDGKPKRMATQEAAERSPRIVKYVRLESYEDALNNIEFDDASGQQAMKFEDYLLKYMLRWETRASETLLNVEKLARPFSYKLHIQQDGQTRAKVADIPETFNYLLGLHVQTRRVYGDDGRRYLVYRGETRDHRKVTVIWRETEGWQKADLERDKKFVAEQKLTEGADEVFVNGDSFIPNARALEPVFKARMFAEVQA